MATHDIFTLEQPLAARLIRTLYVIALILIALGVILGLARGARTATRIPHTPLPIAAQANADASQPQMPAPGTAMGGEGFGPRHGFDGRHFGGFRHHRPGMMGLGIRHHPALFGAFIILRSLLVGAILIMIVRVLAELGLAVLALPRRAEA